MISDYFTGPLQSSLKQNCGKITLTIIIELQFLSIGL